MATTLEKLKVAIAKNIVPDDVIMAILSGLNKKLIPKDPGVLHKALYELKKNSKYHEYLKEFHFDTSGITPFSDLLDRVLYRLETASILVTHNPRYENYEIKRDQLGDGLKKFSGSQKAVLHQMSKDFQAFIDS